MHDRGRMITRQWHLLHLLVGATRGRTLVECAQMFAVHPRTIRRDVQILINAGFAVEWEEDWDGSNQPARIVLPLLHRERADVLRGLSMLRGAVSVERTA